MTKKELEIVCRNLSIRIEQLEKEVKEGISKDPNYYYLRRISDAFDGLKSIDKNDITRKAVRDALKLKPISFPPPRY